MLLVQKVAILGHDGLRVLTVQLESIIHILDDLIVSHALQVASLEKVGAIVLAVLLEDIDMAMGVVLVLLEDIKDPLGKKAVLHVLLVSTLV